MLQSTSRVCTIHYHSHIVFINYSQFSNLCTKEIAIVSACYVLFYWLLETCEFCTKGRHHNRGLSSCVLCGQDASNQSYSKFSCHLIMTLIRIYKNCGSYFIYQQCRERRINFLFELAALITKIWLQHLTVSTNKGTTGWTFTGMFSWAQVWAYRGSFGNRQAWAWAQNRRKAMNTV